MACHKAAMATYGLPMRCISYADHRVKLPDGFVPEVPAAHEPAAPVAQVIAKPAAPAAQQLAAPSAVLAAPAAPASGREDIVDIPEDVVASQPPPHAPPTEEEELEVRRAIVARNNRLRAARSEARARNRARDGS